MKASDVPEDVILRVITERKARTGFTGLLYEIEDALPQFPKKLVLAKLKVMVRKGRLIGCTCGCRGDFEIPEKGTTG